jgi:hypothetical protein
MWRRGRPLRWGYRQFVVIKVSPIRRNRRGGSRAETIAAAGLVAITVSAVLTVGPFGGGSLYSKFGLAKTTLATCPIQIDYVRLAWGIAHEKGPRSREH